MCYGYQTTLPENITGEQVLAKTGPIRAEYCADHHAIDSGNRRADDAVYMALEALASTPTPAPAPAPVRTYAAPMATQRQVDYAWSLIGRAFRAGDPTEFPGRDELAAMTRTDISALITRLRDQH